MAIKTASNRKVTNSSVVASIYSSPVIITSVVVTDSSYNPLDDTSVANTGGYIKVLGIGFLPGFSLYYNGVAVASSTYVSTNEIRAYTNSVSNGSYNLTLFNTNNTGSVYVLSASGFPTWTSSTYSNFTSTVNVQLLATGDAPLTYSLQGGSSLPPGVALSSSGLLSGTVTGISSTTAYTFTVLVDDVQKQTTQQSITLTIVFGDSQFNYTTALLTGEATTTSFNSDASTNNLALTIAGDTKPSTFTPYQGDGYYSNYFDGTGDYLTVTGSTGFNITSNSSNYTIEAWVFPTLAGIQQCIVAKDWVTGNYPSWGFTINSSNRIQLEIGSGTTSSAGYQTLSGLSTIPIAKWTHVAVVVSASTSCKLYVNGVLDNTVAISTPQGNGTNNILIGQNGQTDIFFNGCISNLRITKSLVYTSNFTPSTSPLTTTSQGVSSANVGLLTCQTNRFIDNSTNAYTITLSGDSKISSVSPFVTSSSNYGSTLFPTDSGADYLRLPANLSGLILTADFTLEFWVYVIGAEVRQYFGSTTSGKFRLYTNAGGLQLYNNSGTINISAASAFPATLINQWVHIAISRTGSNLYFFVNGVSKTLTVTSGAVTDTIDFDNQSYIGTYSGIKGFQGYMIDFRIVKGTGVYTANFTPPTSPLTAIANTQLLTLQYNGGANNSGIIDNGSFNNIITRNGNLSQGTFSPYSQTGWSWNFNGSSDYMYSSGGAGIGGTSFGYGTGDFTWECWIYPSSATWTSGNFYICDHGSNGGVMQYNANVFRYYNGSTAYDSASGSISNGVWTHVAVSRISGFTTTYINGAVAKASTADSANFGTSNQFWLARAGGGGNFFPGYISNFRIVKGVGVYTGAFTPSTTPLSPTQSAGTNIAAITSQTVLLICQSNRYINNSPIALAFDGGTTLGYSGNPSVQAFGPFGSISEATPQSYSIYLDGTGDSHLVSGVAGPTGTADFTFECWTYIFTIGGQYPRIFECDTFVSGSFQFYLNNGTLTVAGNGTGDITSYNISALTNQWLHLCVTRTGSSMRLFINGILRGYSASGGNNFPSANNWKTANEAGGIVGYFSNMRIVQGSVVSDYSTAITTTGTTVFTPPTSPLTAISGTRFLSMQSPTIIDNSTNAFTITTTGDLKPRPFNPFGYTAQAATSYTPSLHGGSIYLDGNGDYLNLPTSRLFGFANGDFTIEFWAYPTVNARQDWIDITDSTNRVLVYYSGTAITFYSVPTNAAAITGPAMVLNTWQHIALSKSSGSSKLFVNGVQVGSTYASNQNYFTTSPVTIGKDSAGSTYVTGYMSDIRIIRGTGIYTNNFLPPITPLTNTTTIGTNTYNSVLLINATSGGVIDSHSSNVIETSATVQLNMSVKKYGSSSIYFGTKTDYLALKTNPGLVTFPGDFTIECWVYPSDNTVTYWGIFDSRQSGGSAFAMVFNLVPLASPVAGSYRMQYFNGTNYYGTTTVLSGQWTHLAWVRVGSTLTFYVNGVAGGTATISGTQTGSATTNPIWIGSKDNGSAGYGTVGYIDDLRITNGFARYTGNFTPPTAGFIGQ